MQWMYNKKKVLAKTLEFSYVTTITCLQGKQTTGSIRKWYILLYMAEGSCIFHITSFLFIDK